MNDFFSLEGPFISFLDKCGRVIILSVLWVLCCVPVVTAGASCTAFYYSITKTIVKERSSAAKEFFSAFKRSMKKTLPLSIVFVLLTLILILDISVWGRKGGSFGILSANLCTVLLILLIAFAAWLFPVISRFILPLKDTLRFTAFIMFRYLHITIGMLLLCFILAAAIYINPLFAAFVPGIVCILFSLMIEKVFKKYIPEPEEGKALWYDE